MSTARKPDTITKLQRRIERKVQAAMSTATSKSSKSAGRRLVA